MLIGCLLLVSTHEISCEEGDRKGQKFMVPNNKRELGQVKSFTPSPIDLSLIGVAQSDTGLGSIGIGIADILKNDLKINHFDLGRQNDDITAGNVALLYWYLAWSSYDEVNAIKSHIKLAYSMLESTRIPKKWVANFNENFDAVIVPDEWLVETYVMSGVTIPIFVLPHGIYLEDFLQQPIKKAPNKPFRFGCCSTFIDRKNHHLLIDAFLAEFAGDDSVELVLHGNGGYYFEAVKSKVEPNSIPSIILSNKSLSHEKYIELMKSFDCYVLVSKGEGFSITPREALALGIPTIISNNTAHATICNSGYVSGVCSNIPNKATYGSLDFGDCGYNFHCSIEDVRKELRKVYSNYSEYKKSAEQGREWVKRYLWKDLKNKFHMLVIPKKVILGPENIIGENYLMTNSKELYDKYCDIVK